MIEDGIVDGVCVFEIVLRIIWIFIRCLLLRTVHHSSLVKFYNFLYILFLLVAFKMYDLDNDDMISRDELLAILHMMVGANIR